jgi:hypothetical protein
MGQYNDSLLHAMRPPLRPGGAYVEKRTGRVFDDLEFAIKIIMVCKPLP